MNTQTRSNADAKTFVVTKGNTGGCSLWKTVHLKHTDAHLCTSSWDENKRMLELQFPVSKTSWDKSSCAVRRSLEPLCFYTMACMSCSETGQIKQAAIMSSAQKRRTAVISTIFKPRILRSQSSFSHYDGWYISWANKSSYTEWIIIINHDSLHFHVSALESWMKACRHMAGSKALMSTDCLC